MGWDPGMDLASLLPDMAQDDQRLKLLLMTHLTPWPGPPSYKPK